MCYNILLTPQPTDPAPAPPSATEVGNALAEQYYDHLQNSPELLHRYYTDVSRITRPGLDGVMRSSTLPDIVQDLDMLSSGGFDSVELTSVISQDTHRGCIFVGVYGYVTSSERPPRNFTQSFFLAPRGHDIGIYFVYNDMFKFLDVSEANATIPSANAAVTEGRAICIKNLPPYATTALVEDIFKQFGEIRRGGIEVRSKRSFSYGFVEFKEESAAQKAIEASPITFDFHSLYVERKRPDYKSYWETPSSGPGYICRSVEMRGTEAPGNNELYDSLAIYVRNLPPNATIDWLVNVFTRFGPIRREEVGVYNPDFGYWYGFVKFVDEDAAERAIEASPIWTDGRRLQVRKKFNRRVRNRN